MGAHKQNHQERANKDEEGGRRRDTDQVPSRETEPGFDLPGAYFEPQANRHAALLSKAASDEHRASLAARLQHAYGNAYVQRLVGSLGVQAKMTVNPPGDVYEQEADRVARAVTGGMASDVQRQETPEEEDLLQAKMDGGLQRQEMPEEEELQMRPDTAAVQLPKELEGRIEAARGGGEPLAEASRASLEPQLGHDFSEVRVHADGEAEALSRELSAEAFTTGGHIFFGEGAYQPDSTAGRGLLAHELAHVVQQSAEPMIQRVKPTSAPPAPETMETTATQSPVAAAPAAEAVPAASAAASTAPAPMSREEATRIWINDVVVSITRAHTILGGRGSTSQRARGAFEALDPARGALLDRLVPVYRDRSPANARLVNLGQLVQVVQAGLTAYAGSDTRISIDEMLGIINPADERWSRGLASL